MINTEQVQIPEFTSEQIESFWKLVYKTPSCWFWLGHSQAHGYGRFNIGGGKFLAHRVSYSLIKGSIPAGAFILHACDTPYCVNPEHLFPGNHADNMSDMAKKGRARGGLSYERFGAERNSGSKFTNEQADEIRKLHLSGITQRDLARRFGVGPDSIRRIVHGISYVDSDRLGNPEWKPPKDPTNFSKKLTDEQVSEIRHMCHGRGTPQHVAASIFGVSQSTIHAIVSNKSRTSLDYTPPDKIASVLSEDQKARVREIYQSTMRSNSDIAREFGVSSPTITKITKDLHRPPGYSMVHANRFNSLTQEQADEIRRLYAAGGISQKVLGEKFGVHQVTISDVILNMRYVVPGETINARKEGSTSAKLTMEQAREVRRLHHEGKTQSVIAGMFHVSQAVISEIVLGRSYKEKP